MEPEIADVVIQINGRDKGKRFLVTGIEDGYSLLTDGKGRKLAKSKRKKNKHIKHDGCLNDQVAEKLKSGLKITDSEIRRALAQYSTEKDISNSEI